MKVVERQVFDRDARGNVSTLGPCNLMAIDAERLRTDYPHIERRDGRLIRWSKPSGRALGLAAILYSAPRTHANSGAIIRPDSKT